MNNVLIMTGNFNIKDNNWDPSYSHHLSHTDTLLKVADSFALNLSIVRLTEFGSKFLLNSLFYFLVSTLKTRDEV